VRRLVFVCVLVVIGSAVVAHSFPRRGSGDASVPSRTSQANPAGSAANAPIVIATGVMARSLAVASAATTGADAGGTSLYFTAANQPNRLFGLGLSAAFGLPGISVGEAGFAPIAGSGETGSLGDGGLAAGAQLNLKLDSLLMRSGLAVATDGTIFIADTRNATIRRIAGRSSTEPGIIRSIAGHWAPRQEFELIEPLGIAIDHAGDLFIADHGANQILVMRAAVSQTPGALEVLAHVAQPASVSSTGDGSKVFVGSPENGGVFVIDTRTRGIQSLVGPASQPSACSGSPASGDGRIQVCPAGLAVDGGGNAFIADGIANQILRVDPRTSGITIVARHVANPGEISFDANGDLFVSDQGHERVVEFQGLGQAANSVTLSPASNDFGVEPIGGTSPTATFMLTNGTNAALTDLVVNNFQGADPGEFETISSSCANTLTANSSCLINVAFAPIAVLARSAQLAVTYAGAPALTANLTGVGAEYELGLAKNQNMSVTVVAGTTATYNLELMPDSNFPMNSPYTVTFVPPPIASPMSSTVPPGDLPALTTATFMPASVTVTPGTVTPFSLMIETTSRITGVLGSVPADCCSKPQGPHRPPLFPALAILAAMAAFLGSYFAASRSSRRLRFGSIAGLLLAAAGLINGCGGGGKTKIIGTQPGTANFIIQATVQNAQGASLNVARGFPLQLVVQ
jgi:sugar lactone lactonase YvrE